MPAYERCTMVTSDEDGRARRCANPADARAMYVTGRGPTVCLDHAYVMVLSGVRLASIGEYFVAAGCARA
jgi:hypothetical protein